LLALVLAAAASLAGVALVWRSHQRYQRARGVLLELAWTLGCDGDWQTTDGMREARDEPRTERGPRVVVVVSALLLVYALADVATIVWLLLSERAKH
jgi:hypothetical protein